MQEPDRSKTMSQNNYVKQNTNTIATSTLINF